MEIKEVVSELEDSDVFEEFQKDSDHYLVHAFTMMEKGKDDWQLGYYSEEDDKVVVFEMGDEISKAPEEDVLKKEENTVKELDLEKVKVGYEDAVETAMESKEENHPGERVTKKILILQNLDEGQVYNITLVTTAFNIINVKVSAESGEIVEESKQSIMDLGQPMGT